MKALHFAGDARQRTAEVRGSRWLEHVSCWSPNDPDQLRTGDHETAVLLLHGTFDLVGGTTAWPARGARTTPFVGRPMAVFLPPHTYFRVQNGRGEILLVAARQPLQPAEPQGRELLGRKPLLPLAGSGKAFDPNSGEWKPAETFPTAPESLPPRRFERLAIGALTLERVFAADYKAATLAVDEVVVAAGQSLPLRAVPGRPRCDELMLFVRSEGSAQVGAKEGTTTVRGDAAFVVPANEIDDVVVSAAAGPAYVVLAWAGKA